jgi:hypothetical protein
VPQALALAAQMVATFALLVVLALSLFVLGLALRRGNPVECSARTRDQQMGSGDGRPQPGNHGG